MGSMKKGSKLLYDYKELGIFVLFSIFCAIQAWAKGCLVEFGNIEFWVVLMAGILLVTAVQVRANKLMITAMLLLMTVANLIYACLQVYHFHNEKYRELNKDYIMALVVILVVMIVYPKYHRFLSSNLAIAGMAALTVVIYLALIFFGTKINGAQAWLFGFQLTEPVKILFIFVVAGLLSKRQKQPTEADNLPGERQNFLKRQKNKLRGFLWPILAIGYMFLNIIGMGIISEYGTLIVMFFVFLIFLFIFPNRLAPLGALLCVVAGGIIALNMWGSSVYSDTLRQSPPNVFAEQFAHKVRTVQNEEGQSFSGTEALLEIIRNGMRKLPAEEDAAKEDLERQTNLEALKQQLDAGTITGTDIANKTAEGLTWLEKLCSDPDAREYYLDTFCNDNFYPWEAEKLYNASGSGPVHTVKKLVLKGYNKMIERCLVLLEMFNVLEKVVGIQEIDTPYQVGQAAKAMQIGGLTGASSHEFIYVPVMDSDMVFSEIVSFFGFAMGFFVILMFMIMFREGIRIQRNIDAPFHQGIALGLSLTLFIQALVIIAGNLKLFPLTGITLPFVANGTASLLTCVMMMGILISISFMKIQEETGALDSFFGWVMRVLRADVSDRVHGAARAGSKTVKKGARKVKEMAESLGEEDPDDDIEEDDIEEDDIEDPDDEEDFEENPDETAAEAEENGCETDTVNDETDTAEKDEDDDDMSSILKSVREARSKEKEENRQQPVQKYEPKKMHQPKKKPSGRVTIFEDEHWGDDDDL